MLLRKTFFALVTASVANAAFAGSVISTNLPGGNYIVNVDGRNDGAASFDGGQDRWYQPFATNGSLLELTLDAGTYSFDVIDAIDAHARFTSLTAPQLATIGSSWTYNSPYTTNYLVFDSSAATDASQMQLFAGAGQAGPLIFDGEAAYQETKKQGITDQLVTGPLGRNNGVKARSYTLTKKQTLIFVVPDYALGDNGGVVSVLVSPVPEPATLLGFAAAGLTVLRRRRRSKINTVWF